MHEGLVRALELAAHGIDAVGIVILLWGAALFLSDFLRLQLRRQALPEYLRSAQRVRCRLGSYLLIGLEFMIVSDVINTFVSRTFEDLLFLSVIILIRIAISHFLERELEKSAPAAA